MEKLKIAIASDHGGFELKGEIYNYLLNKGYTVKDFGTNSKDSCDYPIYAKKVCYEIINGNFDKGILICGTGLGMQITANRFNQIRAVCVSDTYSSKMARAHNDANVLTFGARVVGLGLAKEIVDTFFETDFESGRHQKRIDMI